MKKKVCIVTGSRAEYGILKILIQKVIESEKLELIFLVTGMHLLNKYGNSIEIIKRDGFSITKIIPMYDESDISEITLGKAVGKAIINFTKTLDEIKPDILIVFGDRYEPLAAVIAASTLFIPIGHIHGGDNVFEGQIDKNIRHTITKFSHIHFPATLKSYKRIKMLGEEEWRIHMVGSPSIDMIINQDLLNKEKICRKLGLNNSEKIIVCVQHPYLPEREQAGYHMKLTLKILKDLNLQSIIIYPNNDPGSHLIIEEIESNREIPYFKIFKNLERSVYLSLLKNADVMIGNSSSGIIETPIFNLPVVNIGNRNYGRESAENVINAPHDYDKIRDAIIKALSPEFKSFCQNVKNPYGDGKSSERIIKILEDIELNKKFLTKKLDYKI